MTCQEEQVFSDDLGTGGLVELVIGLGESRRNRGPLLGAVVGGRA